MGATSSTQRHARHDRAGRPGSCAAAAASTNISSRRRSPIRTSRCTTTIPEGNSETVYTRSTEQLPPEPKEIKPHPYGVELGRLVTMLKDTTGRDDVAVPDDSLFARQLRRRPQDLRDGQDSARAPSRARSAGTKPTRCIRRSRDTKIAPPATDCICADRRRTAAQGTAPGGARRVLLSPPRGRRPSIAAIRF